MLEKYFFGVWKAGKYGEGGIKPYLPLKSNKIKEKKYESFENLKMGRNSSTKLKTLRLVDVGHFCPEFIDIDSVNTKRSRVGLRGGLSWTTILDMYAWNSQGKPEIMGYHWFLREYLALKGYLKGRVPFKVV